VAGFFARTSARTPTAGGANVISLTDKKSVLMHQHEQAEHCFAGLVCTTARCVREEDGVVIMIDLEEIDLYAAAPGTTNARKIRAGKKNVAKILARARSIPSWKLSLASVRGNRWPAKRKRITLPDMPPRGSKS
jgi:hypothetical protein